MSLSLPGPEASDVGALLRSDASPDQLPRLLLDVHVRAIAEDDPASAQLAPALALPRWFDAAVIGVIRGEPDPPRDERLLRRLSEFNLVLARSDGTYAYHDNLRHILLLEWHGEAREAADDLNRRLADYHLERLAEAERLQRDLEEVGELIAEASETRYARLIAAVRARSAEALREAQYHRIAISPESGLAFFSGQCQRLAENGRLGLCTELIRGAREDLAHQPIQTDADGFARWIDYWDARIAADRGKVGRALDKLAGLSLRTDGQDDKLRLWTLLLQGGLLSDEGRLRESRDALAQATAVIDEVDPDPYNAPAALNQMARLQAAWAELPGARASRRKALATAKEVGNFSVEVSAHIGLMDIALREGAWDEATVEGFTALDLLRSRDVRDAYTHRLVLEALMSLFAHVSSRHLHTLYGERLALVPAADSANANEPGAKLDLALELRYADCARIAGSLAVAERSAEGVQQQLAGRRAVRPAILLAYLQGDLRREQGRLDDARAAYDALLVHPLATAYDRAAALSNRAIVDVQRDPSRAEAELLEAGQAWEDLGHANYLALVAATRAQALVSLGRLSEAEAELARASAHVHEPPPDLEAELLDGHAALSRARCAWTQAADLSGRAAQLYGQVGARRARAFASGRQADALARGAHWEEAADSVADAADAWRELAQLDRDERPPEMEQADVDNAAGTRALYRLEDVDGLHRARASFSRATDHMQEDPWYCLNLAYTCAALADWTAAEAAIDRVIAQGRPWDNAALVSRREEFRAERRRSGQERGSEGLGTRVRRLLRGPAAKGPADA
jgi:hypothetical protein